ncbi:hypothetical protein CEXT_744051 [Caerostris extrusa]|uniref:Uncharacterized protein n=1 Tax=Caerostris extrusa TaxID=172846 RepID=A0AAV4Q6M7_CAEEX|nr:hypothetical protein CEXT_744051 [Caerostris extrusa]
MITAKLSTFSLPLFFPVETRRHLIDQIPRRGQQSRHDTLRPIMAQPYRFNAEDFQIGRWRGIMLTSSILQKERHVSCTILCRERGIYSAVNCGRKRACFYQKGGGPQNKECPLPPFDFGEDKGTEEGMSSQTDTVMRS